MTHTPIDMEKPNLLRVLVVDDDRLSSHNLGIQLKFVGEVPLLTSSGNWLQMPAALASNIALGNIVAIAIGQIQKVDVVELLQAVHRHCPLLPLLLMSSLEEVQYSLLPQSLQAKVLPLGEAALNYETLLTALNKARRMTGHVPTALPSMLISDTGTAMFRSLSGDSRVIQQVRQLMGQIAHRKVTVLVTGESGTGKEVVARNLHYHSGRGDFPFLAINCAAVDPARQGAELFGQQAGYGGTRENLPGLVEQVEKGTLFLDEVADLPLSIQALLLRFLEDGRYQRLGGHDYQVSDVRVVAATRHNLEDNIRSGTFREDLYYRLSAMPVELPALRQRLDDIPALIAELLERLIQNKQDTVRFSTAAIMSLQQHNWPGNVRELANLVERLSIIKPNAEIDIDDLPPQYRYDISTAAERPAAGQPEEGVVRRMPLASHQKPSGPRVQEKLPEPRLRSQGSAQPTATSSSEDPARNVQERRDERQTDGRDSNQGGSFQNNAPGNTGRRDSTGQDPRSNAAMPATGGSAGQALASAKSARRAAPGRIEISPSAELNDSKLQQYLDQFARQMVEVALDDCAGLLPFAAERLRLDSNSLQARMRQHGISTGARG